MPISEAEWTGLKVGDEVRVRMSSGNAYDITLTERLEHGWWKGNAVCHDIVVLGNATGEAKFFKGIRGAPAGPLSFMRSHIVCVLRPNTLEGVLETLSRGVKVDRDTLDTVLRGL